MSIERATPPATQQRVERAHSAGSHPGGQRQAGASAMPGAVPGSFLSLLNALGSDTGTLAGEDAGQLAGDPAAAATGDSPVWPLGEPVASGIPLTIDTSDLGRGADEATTVSVGADDQAIAAAAGAGAMAGSAGSFLDGTLRPNPLQPAGEAMRPSTAATPPRGGLARQNVGPADGIAAGRTALADKSTEPTQPAVLASLVQEPLVAPQPLAGLPGRALARLADVQSAIQASDTARANSQAAVLKQAEPVMAVAATPLVAMAGALRELSGARDLERNSWRGLGGNSPMDAMAFAAPGGSDASQAAAASTYVLDPLSAAPDVAIAQRVHYWISRGVQTAEMQLDTLGGGLVDVSVTVQGNEAAVEFRTDQPEARRLLQDAMPHLKDLLRSEGMTLAGGYVGTSAQQDPSAQGRKPDAGRAAVVQGQADSNGLARSVQPVQTSGRTVDVFV